MGSMPAVLVISVLIGSCHFDSELGMPSCQFLVGQSTGNVSVLWDVRVGSSLSPSPPPQNWYILPVPNCCQWATGSFCAGYGCALPIYGTYHIY